MFTIKNVLVLDGEGRRVLCKYYGDDLPTLKEQQKFEKDLFKRTQRSNAEILLMDQYIVVFRNVSDVFFYVTGGIDENELTLLTVLNAIYDTMSKLVNTGSVPRSLDLRSILENFDFLVLTVDELIDRGIVLETDPNILETKVSLRSSDDIPLAEQTISQALQSAKDQITRSLIR